MTGCFVKAHGNLTRNCLVTHPSPLAAFEPVGRKPSGVHRKQSCNLSSVSLSCVTSIVTRQGHTHVVALSVAIGKPAMSAAAAKAADAGRGPTGH
jgi:hypothetical protein